MQLKLLGTGSDIMTSCSPGAPKTKCSSDGEEEASPGSTVNDKM